MLNWLKNNPGKTGFGVMFLGCGGLTAIALCLVALAGVGGYFILPSGEETEEVATMDEGEEVEAEEETEEEIEDSGLLSSWSPEDWWDSMTGGGDDEDEVATSEGTDDEDETSDAGTATTATAPTAPATATAQAAEVITGIMPSGSAFTARNAAGMGTPTLAIVIEDVPGSARAEHGLTEELWLQGVHTDATSGVLVTDVSPHKVVDLDDIRRKVGVKQTWQPIDSYLRVFGKCSATGDANGGVPGPCTPDRHVARR